MPNKFTAKISVLILLISLSFNLNGQLQFHRNDTIDVIKGVNNLDLAWFGGLNNAQFSKVDLNLNGIDDLVVFDRSDSKILTFINNGTPNQPDYTYNYYYERFFPAVQNWLLMRDYNLDGKVDIFCFANSGIKVYKNTSTISTRLSFELVTPLLKSDQYPGGLFNLYVPSTDIPAISDIDGDGDLDVLSFGVLGAYIEYHQNMSVENYGTADSLKYVLQNNCWGYFSESGSTTNKLKLYDSCYYNVPSPRSARHAGSTLLAFDNNNDNVADLLLGDVSFGNVVLATNGGAAPNMNSAMASQDTAFPSYNTSVDLTLFPGMFYEDVDNDNIKDLLCSPNTNILTENANSVWYYKNNGTNSLPNFNYVKNNFLQDETIELGEGSIPSFLDYNGNGLMDMVISSYGYFVRATNTYISKLSLYENTGTSTMPEFTFVTDDYQNISALNLGLSLHPTFADIDNDGDQDMLLGDSEGKLHILTNSAGAGNTAVFGLTLQNIIDSAGIQIDVGQFAAPQLYDYDNDNDFDLIIGEKNGIISYYKNIGTPALYKFKKITDSLGKVEIHEPWDTYGSSTGYSTPFFFKESGTTYMMSGGQQGEMYLYSNINPANPNAPFTLTDTIIAQGEIGLRTIPHVIDINNNGGMDFLVGSLRGGVSFFYSGQDYTDIEITETLTPTTINLYPNPAKELINISIQGDYADTPINYAIYNVIGKRLTSAILKTNTTTTLDLSDFKNGIYFINFSQGKNVVTKKFVVGR
jgi:hypothetical protein